MIENILIVDTETNGLMPERGDQIIEIAAVLFNLKYKTVLQSFATLYPCTNNPVEHINHINVDATQCNYSFVRNHHKEEMRDSSWDDENSEPCIFHEDRIKADNILIEMLNMSQAVVAHNAQFDKKFIKSLECGAAFLNKPWICTKAHFTWPMPLKRFRLQDICEALRVPYENAHRALSDCLLLAQCFEKIEDLQYRFNR